MGCRSILINYWNVLRYINKKFQIPIKCYNLSYYLLRSKQVERVWPGKPRYRNDYYTLPIQWIQTTTNLNFPFISHANTGIHYRSAGEARIINRIDNRSPRQRILQVNTLVLRGGWRIDLGVSHRHLWPTGIKVSSCLSREIKCGKRSPAAI